jgi:hypothetical protein
MLMSRNNLMNEQFASMWSTYPKIEMHAKYIEIDNDTFWKFFDNTEVMVLDSGTGSGKTTCTADTVAKYQLFNNHITLLSITNLISLANQQVITFKNKSIPLLSYQEKQIKADKLMSKNSVICINSLHKLCDQDFKNKIIYIDEVHSLCNSLSHNSTIDKQRLVFNTLLRAINTCHKVIVSDAHIFNATMHLLKSRIEKNPSKLLYIKNTHKKFEGKEAMKFTDENEFYQTVRANVLEGKPFSFACDSKAIIDKWYTQLKSETSLKTQKQMLIYTSKSDEEIRDDWKDKMIFYSPKISTGVDISILEQTEQFIYITGKSVSPIILYQMSTRTRNMNQLSYFTDTKSVEREYTSLQDCRDKTYKEFSINVLQLSSIHYEYDVDALSKYDQTFFDIYCTNCYLLDLFGTDTVTFFENELSNVGFILSESENDKNKLEKEITNEMKEKINEINEEKYQTLIDTLEQDENEHIPVGIQCMKDRSKLLNLHTREQLNEYQDIVENEDKFEHVLNYNRLNKSFDYCKSKLNTILENKMTLGVHANVWNKILYIHKLAQLCQIGDDLFNLRGIQPPDVSDMKTQKMITAIKTLYNKRDSLKTEDYTGHDFIKLYKFMLDNLIKKLNLIQSKQGKSAKNRDKQEYIINIKTKKRYDTLISIMNPRRIENNDVMEEDD